jgi:hypothetical protein
MRLSYAEAWDMFFNQEQDEDLQGEVDYDLAEKICLREMKEEQLNRETT